MKHIFTKTMFFSLLVLGLYFSYTGFEDKIADYTIVAKGLILAIVSTLALIKLYGEDE